MESISLATDTLKYQFFPPWRFSTIKEKERRKIITNDNVSFSRSERLSWSRSSFVRKWFPRAVERIFPENQEYAFRNWSHEGSYVETFAWKVTGRRCLQLSSYTLALLFEFVASISWKISRSTRAAIRYKYTSLSRAFLRATLNK